MTARNRWFFPLPPNSDLLRTLDSLPVRLYTKDISGHFTYMNKHCLDQLGLHTASWTNDLTDSDFFEDACAAQWAEEEDHIIRTGMSIVDRTEKELFLNGTVRWARTCKVPVYSTTKSIIGIFGVTHDITDEHNEMDRLRHAIAGSNDGVWHRDLETGAVWFSARWKEMLGYQDEDIPNNIDEFWSRVHPEDVDKVRQSIARHISGRTTTYQCDFRIRSKSSQYLWISSRGKATADQDGRRFAGSHTDITAMKRNELFLDTVLNSLNSFIFVKDDSLRFRYVNDPTARLFGLPVEAVIDRTDRDLNRDASQVAHFERADLMVLNEQIVVDIPEEQITFADGTTHTLTTKKLPLRDHTTGKLSILGISNDITTLRTHANLTSRILDVLLDAIHAIEAADTEDAACQCAIVHLGMLGHPNCMISFLQLRDNLRYIIAEPKYASTALWRDIADSTERQYDVPYNSADILVRVLQSRKSEYVADSRTNQHCDVELCRRLDIRSQYIAPLATDALLIGTLQVNFGDDKEQPVTECAMIDAMAAHLSLAIDRHRTRKALDDLHSQLLSHTKLIAFESAAIRIVHELNHSISNYLMVLNEYCRRRVISQNRDAMELVATTRKFVDQWTQSLKENLSSFKSSEERNTYDIRAVLREAIDGLYIKVKARKCNLSLAVDDESELFVHATVGALREMLSILVINAIEANSRNILVRIKRTTGVIAMAPVQYAEISVEDDGEGIADEVHSKIMDLGWTSKKSGHGLGLGIVDLLARDLGGSFWLASGGKSAGKQQTVFILRIPLAR